MLASIVPVSLGVIGFILIGVAVIGGWRTRLLPDPRRSHVQREAVLFGLIGVAVIGVGLLVAAFENDSPVVFKVVLIAAIVAAVGWFMARRRPGGGQGS